MFSFQNGSIIKTEAEIQADKEYAERMREQKEKLSKERKDRMKELEKRSVLLAKKSDVEIAEIAKKQAIRNMAEKKRDGNADVVKLLNSMAQRATEFTIRDQQLEEKEREAWCVCYCCIPPVAQQRGHALVDPPRAKRPRSLVPPPPRRTA